MSSKLHGLVWEGCAFSGMILSRVAVMARLADYSNDDGVSWPAVETIQRQIGARSKNTVSNAINELEHDGWLVKQERKAGGRNFSNVYHLNVPKLEKAAEAARKAYKPKKYPSKDTCPSIEELAIKGSTVEGSMVEGSNFDRSTIEKNEPINPPMVDPDPSVKTDPSLKTFSSQNSDESSDTPPNVDFLAKHPEAVVCTPKGTKWASQQDLDCAGWIFNRIQDLSQRLCASQPKQPNWTEWGNEIRLMREIDGHSHREICELFKRVNQDAFWCRNVLSPRKLREKWDDLTLKLSSPGGAAAKSGKAELDFNNTDWIYGIENELRNAGVGA